MSIWGKIFGAIGSYFVGFFKAVIGSAAAKSIEDAIKEFVVTDIGTLAVDACAFVSVQLPGADNVALRDAAKAKLEADALKAGKDLKTLGESSLNLFIEMAYTAIKTGLVKVASSAILAAV